MSWADLCVTISPPLNASSAGPSAGQQYAPPPGPPPPRGGSEQAGRPNLPTRPSVAVAAKAQPDDLEDVKKVGPAYEASENEPNARHLVQLCGMGFARELVISALEANDYNLQKTLNVLLPGQ